MTTNMTQNDSIEFAPDFARALAFFQSHEKYAPSPLHELQAADGLRFWAKDETGRMGLGAFKAMGAPYAVARLIDAAWQAKTGETLTSARMKDADVRGFAADLTFVCASAGNHGLGVAFGAQSLGAKSRIHLAKTVPASFADRLRAFGAEVVWSGAVYEESVTAAIADAEASGDTLLADGTWPGYTDIPKWVMEGYCVIAEELRQSFEAVGQWPTHVYLQAGVGGLAAAMAHMIRLNWAQQPELIVVEPDAAACLKISHEAGVPTRAVGPASNMGRLDCKDASIVAWHVLERCDVVYETLTEAEGEAAAKAVTALGIATTPSGAAGFGAMFKHRKSAGPTAVYHPLVIISEGLA